MALHPQARAVLVALAAYGDPPLIDDTPVEARARRRARLRAPIETIHRRRDLDAGGVPARLYQPSDAPELGLLVYLHGGGWVLGSLDGHENVCRALANHAGAAVLSLDYRLAPEHPFPAALDDARGALGWAHDHAAELGVHADRLAIGGDSAGANLAAVVALAPPVPLRYQVLAYPITDARGGFASYEERADGYVLTADDMAWFVGHYLSGDQGTRDDPLVSPLLASDTAVGGAPPAWLATAEFDPLRDEGRAYAERLRSAGVEVTYEHYDEMMHGFFSQADLLDDGQRALAAAATALAVALV